MEHAVQTSLRRDALWIANKLWGALRIMGISPDNVEQRAAAATFGMRGMYDVINRTNVRMVDLSAYGYG